MEIVPSFEKTEVFSAFISVTSKTVFLGNLCLGAIVTIFSDVSFNIGEWNVNVYKIVFLVSFMVRIFAAFTYISSKYMPGKCSKMIREELRLCLRGESR